MWAFLKLIGLCFLFLAGTFAYFVMEGPLPKTRSQSVAQQEHSNQRYEIIMYSLTTCGRCTVKRRELHDAGVRFREYFIDQDQSMMQTLSRKLAAQGIGGGRIGTPVFEINGNMMMGNPPLSKLMQSAK